MKACYILLALVGVVYSETETLPTFNVDKNLITVSGISAGACFATQFHVAYSKDVVGKY